ncbi:MAG: exopolysaccharide biosynthesis protein [Parvularculaceae bacterium]
MLNGTIMIDAAAAAERPSDPRAAIKGVTALLRDILDDLEKAPPPQPDLTPNPAGSVVRDPVAAGRAASLGDVVDRLDERGFGLLFFLLALPCIPPFVYVLPQIVSLPMLGLAAQMAMGRTAPWFPESIRKRTFSIGDFRKVLDRMEKYVRFVERFSHPRLKAVTTHGAARIVGALMAIPALSILVPLIGTNTVPSIGIALASLGLISRDGLLVVLGLLIGVLWPIFLFGLIAFLGVEGLHIAKEWLLSRF